MSVDPIFLVGGSFSPAGAESSFRRGLERIGVRTVTFPGNDPLSQVHRLLQNRIGYHFTIRSYRARRAGSRRFNHELEEAVLRSEAPTLLVLKGEFVMPETLGRLRQRGIKVIVFYPDNPFPPHSSQRPETLPAARETDLYLIWSERLVVKLRNAGVRNPAFLPFAWDPEVFPFDEEDPQGAWPGALFLGGWDAEREAFLEELASHVPLRIFGPKEWGVRTKSNSRVRRAWQGRDLRMADAAHMLRESAVCLNLLRKQHIIDGAPDGLIMRHFEVPGAGGFLMSTRGTGASNVFPEGETGEYFSDVLECAEKTKYYIANQFQRKQLTARAHSEVAARHQYSDRARQLVGLITDCR